jgi:hypothetical protein
VAGFAADHRCSTIFILYLLQSCGTHRRLCQNNKIMVRLCVSLLAGCSLLVTYAKRGGQNVDSSIRSSGPRLVVFFMIRNWLLKSNIFAHMLTTLRCFGKKQASAGEFLELKRNRKRNMQKLTENMSLWTTRSKSDDTVLEDGH